MADDPPALEQHHCDAGANFVRIDLRPDACAGSVIAYRKIDLTTDAGRLRRNRRFNLRIALIISDRFDERNVCPRNHGESCAMKQNLPSLSFTSLSVCSVGQLPVITRTCAYRGKFAASNRSQRLLRACRAWERCPQVQIGQACRRGSATHATGLRSAIRIRG